MKYKMAQVNVHLKSQLVTSQAHLTFNTGKKYLNQLQYKEYSRSLYKINKKSFELQRNNQDISWAFNYEKILSVRYFFCLSL